MKKDTFPKISLVTVVYNSSKYLERTFNSIFSQNYPNLEYIVIDGGSTDGSVDIIKKYQHKISFWVSEKDMGMYDALNKGFSHATGDICCWLNSDDEYYPHTLFQVAKIFSDLPQVEWITGLSSVINDDNLIISCKKQVRLTQSDYLNSDYGWIQQESTFWRKSLMDKLGSSPFELKYKFAGDMHLWFKFFQYTKLYYIDVPLGKFRTHECQLSKDNIDKYCSECKTIISSYTASASEQKEIKKLKRCKLLLRILCKINRTLHINIFDIEKIRTHLEKKQQHITLGESGKFIISNSDFQNFIS